MSVLYVHDKSNHEGQQQHPQISSLSFELCMWDANLDFPDANLGFKYRRQIPRNAHAIIIQGSPG